MLELRFALVCKKVYLLVCYKHRHMNAPVFLLLQVNFTQGVTENVRS